VGAELAERVPAWTSCSLAPAASTRRWGNPWDQFYKIVVSRDFLRTDRAREAFDAADKDWDLTVVDEAAWANWTGRPERPRAEQPVRGYPADPGPLLAVVGAGRISNPYTPPTPPTATPHSQFARTREAASPHG
jgi:hypothetical protein